MVKTKEIEWKNVNFDNPELATAGLVAIEECTNYDANNFSFNLHKKAAKRKNTAKQTDKKAKKRTKSENGGVIKFTPSLSGSSFQVHETEKEELDDYLHWQNYGVPQLLVKGIKQLGFIEPTQIQAATLPAAILGHRDILGAAETGSGKTLAFGLPILTGILELKANNSGDDAPLYALILTPTRELAVQIKNHLVSVAKFTDINVAVVVGGMAAVKQERILSKNPEIVVATPGRLWELIEQGNSHLSKISDLKYLVIDETDRMLERGHFEELHNLLERLNIDDVKKKNRQNFVFSATLSLVHELPRYLAKKFKRKSKETSQEKLQGIVNVLGITNPKIVDVTVEGCTSKTLSECRIACEATEKDYYTYYFLQRHPGRTIIFCNSIGCVKRLANLLNILECNPLPLHASMQQRQRLKNLERFRDDEHGVLIATDVAARGLDIPKIEHVLHYQTPRTSESYVHRSGRTARATKEGITVLLIEPAEIKNYIRLCNTLQKSEDLPLFPVDSDYLSAVKERVNLARQIDTNMLHVRKFNAESGWLKKAVEEMDIIVDDFSKFEDEPITGQKKSIQVLKSRLSSLLSKTLQPHKGFIGKYPINFTELYDQKTTAVELLKNSVKTESQGKKRKLPIFRVKKQYKKAK